MITVTVGTDRAVIRGIADLHESRPGEPIAVRQLEDHLGYSESTIRRALGRLIRVGLLRRLETTTRGCTYEVVNVR